VVSPRASIKGGKLLSAGLKWDRVEEMLLLRGMSRNDIDKIREQLPARKAA
jgi:hypothetical protein